MVNIDQKFLTTYWNNSIENILTSLGTSETGLSKKETEARHVLYGPNELAKTKRKTILLAFLSKFLNPLILILLGASLISALVGQVTEFWIIQVTIIVGTILDFYQEYNAERAAEKLRQRVSLTATVLRDGSKQEIAVSKLVPGDIIFLSVGDIVPADSRLLSVRDLSVDQAALTGESYPQEKKTEVSLSQTALLTERVNCVFMGTTVTAGEGRAVIINTGKKTEFGKVAQQLTRKRPITEFEKGIKEFGIFLMKIVLVLTLVAFLANALFKHEWLESLLFALALAVGITPELLPMIITINLSRGAVRMARKKVIVKDLQAIQNLGSMEILCTDKTGTLTESTIKLVKYEDIAGKPNDQLLIYGFLNSAYQTGLKSPLAQSMVSDYTNKLSYKDYTMVNEIPFDFHRKRLSVVVKHKGKLLLITKGAPEGIFPLCNYYFGQEKTQAFTARLKQKVMAQFRQLSTEGYRVVVVAFKEVKSKSQYILADEKELTYLGLMSFFDPPKKTALEALQLLEKQGVEVKILTGDNEEVTRKVCTEIGLPVGNILLGSAIEKMSEEELMGKAKETTIFARLNPEQKRQIIALFKKSNAVTGYLGDGINDAPSLREADVGISVNNAVDVAKEAADLILLQKDLHVLKNGVEEGRKTYGNIMKYILMETSSNFGNMFSVAISSLFLPFLPMLPVQILLNNLLYEISQLGIPVDHVDSAYLHRPKKWNINFIRHFMWVFGPISSIFDLLTFVILLFILKASVGLFQTSWFIESLTTQSLVIFSIRTKITPFYKSKPSFWLLIISLIIIGIGWWLPFSPLGKIFSFVPPPFKFYLILTVLVLVYIGLVEKTKQWFYSKYEL